jgi:hypothetical protein
MCYVYYLIFYPANFQEDETPYSAFLIPFTSLLKNYFFEKMSKKSIDKSKIF